MNRGLSERDWAIMYMAWLNELPLSDTIWRFHYAEMYAKDGHFGSCTKSPGSCSKCLVDECTSGGRKMAEAWEKEAQNDPPDNPA